MARTIAYHLGCHERVVGSIHNRVELKKINLNLTPRSTQPQIVVRKKCPGEGKAIGVILSISPTEWKLFYINMGAIFKCQVGFMA